MREDIASLQSCVAAIQADQDWTGNHDENHIAVCPKIAVVPLNCQ